MKSKLTFKLSCILVALLVIFPMFQSYAKPNKYNHLELVGMSGISTTPGVFSSAYTPTFWLGNFFKQGMDFDQEGNLYLADSGECQIEVFSNDLKPLRHFGSIGSQPEQFQLLMDLKVSQDQVYALDYTLASVKVFHLDGTFQYEFSTQVPEDEFTSYPSGLAVSNHQHIFVMDLRNGLKMFDLKGKFIKYIDLFSGFNWDSESEHNGGIQDLKTDDKGNLFLLFNFGGDGSPMVLHTDPEGNLLTNYQEGCCFMLSDYYTSNGCFALENNTIYGILWDSYSYLFPEEDEKKNHVISGFKYTYSLDPCEFDNFEYFFDEKKENPCPVEIQRPTAFSVKNQQLFILDSSNNSLHKFSDQGELLQSYQSPERTFGILSNICYQQDGQVFVSDMNQSKVHRLDKDLGYIQSIREEADPDIFPSPGDLHVPQGVCTDWRNYLYVADYGLNCVQVFDEKGQGIATIFPQETFGHFSDLTINDKGNLLVSSVSYGYESGMMILEFDIQQIDQGKHHQIKATPLPLHRYYHPQVSPEYGSGPFLPASEGGFVLPCYACGHFYSESHDRTIYQIFDAKGKKTQTIPDLNHRNDRPDQGIRPQGITYGADHSFFVVDHWCGVWWKFDDQHNPLWDECIQWFGLYSVCTDSEGYIYAIDQAHSLVLKFKDHSFRKPSSDNPLALNLTTYPSMTLQDSVSISGSVNPGSLIYLDNKPIFVNRKGEFYATVFPKVGSNRWILRVQAPSNEEHEKTIEIFRKEKTLIRMNIGKTQVRIDQEERKLEAPPFIDPGSKRSYCPIRMVVEAIGGSIQWLAEDQKVLIYLPNLELSLKVNSPEAYLNGNKISIDSLNEDPKGVKVVPKLVNGRVFLPLRFVAEQLKYKVEWLAETQEIRLHYPNNVVLPEAWNKLVGLFPDQDLLGSYSSDAQHLTLFVRNKENTGFLQVDASGKITQAKAFSLQGLFTAPLKEDKYLLIGTQQKITRQKDPRITICILSKEGEIISSREIVLEDQTLISRLRDSCQVLRNSNGSTNIILGLSNPREETEWTHNYHIAIHLDYTGKIVSLYTGRAKNDKNNSMVQRSSFGNGIFSTEVIKEQGVIISQQSFNGEMLWSYLVEHSNKKNPMVDNPYLIRKMILEDGSILVLLPVQPKKMTDPVELVYMFMINPQGKLQWQKILTSPSESWRHVNLLDAKKLSQDQFLISLQAYTYYPGSSSENPVPSCYHLIIDSRGTSIQEITIDPKLINCNYLPYQDSSWLVSKSNSVPNLLVRYQKNTQKLFPYSIPSSPKLKISEGDLLFSHSKSEGMQIEFSDTPYTVKDINIKSQPAKPLLRSILF
jgi:hypothetical protein